MRSRSIAITAKRRRSKSTSRFASWLIGGYQEAKRIISERAEALVRIAEALLEREVLDGAEVKALIDGGTLPPIDQPKNTDDPKGQPDASARRRYPRSGTRRRESAACVIPAFPVYLFDVDGTLVDSAADICGAIQTVLANTPRNDVERCLPEALHRLPPHRPVRRSLSGDVER